MAINKQQSLCHPATLDAMSENFPVQHTPRDTYRNSVGVEFPGTLMEKMGMTVIEHSAQRTVISMPVSGNTQRIGILHGGASAALAETAGSLAASAVISSEDHIAVGVELSISHVRPATSGCVTATAQAEHLGRSATVHTVRITDDDGHLVALARMTNRIIERR